MAEKRNIRSCQDELKRIKHHIDWQDLEVNKVYHIPPIITIERMDIIILGLKDDKITFRIVGSKENDVKSMAKSSILSRFLVKRHKY